MGHPFGPSYANPFELNTPIANGTSAYTAGDAVGALLTIDAPSPVSTGDAGPQALVNSLVLIDTENKKPALDVLFFDQAPTDPGDNAAFAPSAADAAKLVGMISIATTDWKTFGSRAFVSLGALAKSMQYSGHTLYALVVIQSTPTYSGSSALRLKLSGITT